jgi:tetratricopeptide (TPR) repeat protein
MAHYQNHFHEALDYAEEGIKSFVEDGKRIYRKYFLLLNRAIYLEDLNRKEEALQALEELKIAINEIKNTSEVFQNVRTSVIVKMYRMYAKLLNELEMPNKAVEECEKGIRIAWLNNDFDRVFTLWTTMGTIYYNIGDYENTEKFYFKALDIRPKVKEEFLYPFNYVNLGILLIKQHKLQDAKQYIEDAIKISKEYKDYLALTESLMAMGQWCIQQNLHIEAINLYNQAKEIAQQNNFLSKESEILTNLCICFEEISDEIEFQKHTVQLFRIRKKLMGRRV